MLVVRTTLEFAVVNLGPLFVETFVLPIREIELVPFRVPCRDQHMDMQVVGVGVTGIKRWVVPKGGSLDPLLGHLHRPLRFHLAIEAQHRPVVAPLSPALFG